MCVHANAKTNKVVNTPAEFRVDVTYSLSTPQGISEVCDHVINLSPVQQGPDVVSSLEFCASLYRLPSKIDCCHVVWQKFLFSKDNINTVFLGVTAGFPLKLFLYPP